MKDTFKIKVYETFDGIDELWKGFEEESACYAFQSYTWLRNWYNFIGSVHGIRLCIIVVEYPEGQPLMLLPMGIQAHWGFRCLVWLGGKITDYQGPLLKHNYSEKIPTDLFFSIWKTIQQKLPLHDAVYLEKQPVEIAGLSNPFLELSCVPHPSNSHVAHLPDRFDDFLKQRRNGKWLSTHRRKQRRLAEQGQISFVIAKEKVEIDRILKALLCQKSRNYREMGVTDLFGENGYRKFFEYMSSRYINDDLVHLSALSLDENILATHWGLAYKGRFYYLFPSYESDLYAQYSPGTLLLQYLFEWCIENDINIFDFTDGDEPYKSLWCDQIIKLYDYFEARTFKGHLCILLLRLKRRAKLEIKQSERLLKLFYKIRSKNAMIQQNWSQNND
jgi:CelD/BcsL family acetyltransferase involved in cellulose biosynthesis